MGFLVQGIREGIELLYALTGDYGIAIVCITVVIRVLMLPLGRQQRKYAQNQQELNQEVEALKEKYKKNPEKMNDELQKLYQTKGVGGGGCLVSLLQFPVMICLYQGIRLTAAAGTATVLLPWVSSLLVRDQMFILPIATIFVQILPQIYPYLPYFKALRLQKPSVPMVLTLMLTNSIFAFMIPSGIGLYYFVSGLFYAGEQFAVHCAEMKRAVLR